MDRTVNRNEAIWNFTATGSKPHAFVSLVDGKPYMKRALCRANVTTLADGTFFGVNGAANVCAKCLKLAEAMWDRAEASMAPSSLNEDSAADHWLMMGALHAEAIREDVARDAEARLADRPAQDRKADLDAAHAATRPLLSVVPGAGPADGSIVIHPVAPHQVWFQLSTAHISGLDGNACNILGWQGLTAGSHHATPLDALRNASQAARRVCPECHDAAVASLDHPLPVATPVVAAATRARDAVIRQLRPGLQLGE